MSILFAVLATVAIVCGLLMIAQDNPVRSALYLVIVLFCVALLYLSLNAAFIAAIQIVVYAGAIMVLFIFVIMLLNMGSPDKTVNQLQPQTPLALLVGLVLAGIFLFGVLGRQSQVHVKLSQQLVGANEIGLALFTPTSCWLLPFEVVSILLLVAAVGAVMLAKKRI